jgi:hypothetical protein
MVRAGELPKRRTVLRTYLSSVREGLIRDLAVSEEGLTTAQGVLVDRVVSLLSIVRCIEEHTRETGVFKGRELAPVLAKCYCTYSAELRRVLETLGISTKAGKRLLSPLEITAEIDAAKASSAKEAGEGENAPLGASESVQNPEPGSAEGV